MVDSFDITKKYKLVDVVGYLDNHYENRAFYNKYFSNNILNNDLVVEHKYNDVKVIKSVCGYVVVGSSELKYLEEIKEEEPMKEINYTADWYMDCPKTEEEWNVFVQIMKSFGVGVFDRNFNISYSHIFCKNNLVVRGGNVNKDRKKVTLLEAITLLQRPIKTEQQIQIEKLEQTIAQAQEQIKNLKATVKQ